MIGVTLMILMICLFLTHFLLKRHYSYWKVRGVPYLESKFPFGNLRQFCLGRQYLGDAFEEIYKAFKGLKMGGVFNCLNPVLVLVDAGEIKNFLTKDFQHFNARDEKLDRNVEFMQLTLFHMQDKDEWKGLRSQLMKSFSSAKIKSMFTDMCRSSDAMINKLSSIAPFTNIDMKEIMSDFTTEVTFACFYGLNMSAEEIEKSGIKEVRDAVVIPKFSTVLRMFLYNMSRSLPKMFKLRLLPKFVTDYFLQLTSETIKVRESLGINRNDLFDVLHNLRKTYKNNDIDTMTDLMGSTAKRHCIKMELDLMAAQCFVFYAAAFETSAFTVCSALHALSKHPEIQKKVQDELDKAISKHGGLTYDAMQELKYTDTVIWETLRLCPPVPELTRLCTKAYKTTEGLSVEPGVRVVVPIYAIHRDPEIFPEPMKFQPERFYEGLTPYKYAYMPFGEGPRSCIGIRFGIIQTKIAIASVLSKFNVHSDEKYTFPPPCSPKIFVTAVNKDGFWLNISPRC